MKNHADALIFHTRICAVNGPNCTFGIDKLRFVSPLEEVRRILERREEELEEDEERNDRKNRTHEQ